MRTVLEKIRFIDEHYYYEVTMMFKSYFFEIDSNNLHKYYFTNIQLETFIFHARNLIEFYYSGNVDNKDIRKYKDDAWAIDFINDKNKWYKLRPEIDSWKDIFLRRAGKEMAHLSYSRLDLSLSDKLWNIFEIAEPIKNITILFIDNIDEEFKTKRIIELCNYLKNI